MIPARYEASRFPGKLMKDLAGSPVILRTYQAAVDTGLFDSVLVVTDSPVIEEVISADGGTVFRSKKNHESGSDRIAEAAEHVEADIIVNVQGDEPFIDKTSLAQLIQVFKEDKEHQVDLASLMTPITDEKEIANPNVVKVIVDTTDLALYFSRAPIPYKRDTNATVAYHRHLGVYAFRKKALLDFQQMEIGVLEASENIEAIRFLEQGKKIKMVVTQFTGIGIDTQEDLDKARKQWT